MKDGTSEACADLYQLANDQQELADEWRQKAEEKETGSPWFKKYHEYGDSAGFLASKLMDIADRLMKAEAMTINQEVMTPEESAAMLAFFLEDFEHMSRREMAIEYCSIIGHCVRCEGKDPECLLCHGGENE